MKHNSSYTTSLAGLPCSLNNPICIWFYQIHMEYILSILLNS